MFKKEGIVVDRELLESVVEDLNNINKPYFKTGFIDLDELLSLRRKSALITVGARPAMGKTAFMYNIMENVAGQGKKCLLFSLEMSKTQVAGRLICQHSEVDFMKLRAGVMSEKDWEKIAETLNFLTEIPISIDDTCAMNIEEIEEKIKDNKPEVVFIDYLQLISASKKKDRYNQIEDIMKNLKRISEENEIIIFISSPLSRAVENRMDKRPMLSDLRDSGSIENISDIVMFLYRSDYYSHGEDDESALYSRGCAEIIVAKNKFGPVGTIMLKFIPSITKFKNPTVERIEF